MANDNLAFLISALKSFHCFSQLDESSLAQLAVILDVAHFTDGQNIITEGSNDGDAHLIRQGRCRVVKELVKPDGNKETVFIAELETGGFTGLGSTFTNLPHSATVVADGPVETYKLSRDSLMSVLSKDTTVSVALLSYIAAELKNRSPMLLQITDGSLVAASAKLSIAFFDSKKYQRDAFDAVLSAHPDLFPFNIKFIDARLGAETASLAAGCKVVCVFVNDRVCAKTVQTLSNLGVEMIAVRAAGFEKVDLKACDALGISVARVPAYSPYAVAEHAVALLMALNRKTSLASSRIRNGNFELNGLVGFDIHGKTAGIIGTGKIGVCLANILLGFGCDILAFDPYPSKDLLGRPNVRYVELDELLTKSDIISLHAPLTKESYHLINKDTIAKMKKGVVLLNTGRGPLIDSQALIDGLKEGVIGAAGLDVYEKEEGVFFEDKSATVMSDDILARLLSFNNVMITGHQAFLTNEALGNIARCTLDNVAEFAAGKRMKELKNSINFM